MTKVLTAREKAAIAGGFRGASTTQAAYAAEQGISERTLRSWLKTYAPRQVAPEQVLAIIDEAVEKLLALRAGVDADAARRAADVREDALNEATEPAGRHDVAEPAFEVEANAVAREKEPPQRPKPLEFFAGYV